MIESLPMDDPEVTALRRFIGPTVKRRKEIAAVLGVNEQSLYQIIQGIPLESGQPRGVGRRLKLKLTRHFPEWLSAQDDRTPSVPGGSRAQTLHSYTLPPRVTWEEVMRSADLPGSFILEMPDDALSPSVAKGTGLIFEPDAEPAPLKGVLVQDKTGRRYVRRYVEGPGGTWSAEAIRNGYVTLESERDGLVLLAVMTGRLDGFV